MKSKCFRHSPIPLNVPAQTGWRSQSSLVSGDQFAPLVLMPCRTCQCISPSLFLRPVDVGLHVAFWLMPWYCITILSGVISTGHSCLAPAEHEAGELSVITVRLTHTHYLNTTFPLSAAMQLHGAEKLNKSYVSGGNRKRLRKDTPFP